ncbi:MAG: carboxymuconolactone decarboxylase family protein [Anaerolineae bacterium]
MSDYPQTYEKLRVAMKELGSHIPDVMTAFGQLHAAGASEGVLSSKVKELIALGIAITVRCDGCIAFHVHDAIKAGATAEEITEVIGVAILMGGGPAMVYGCEALEALKQFEAVEA